MYHDKEWLRKKYIDEGLSTTKLGKICGVDSKTIWSWMKKFNIPCKEKHFRKRAVKICPVCGKEFEVFWHDRNKTIYCSNKCRLYALHRNKIKKIINEEFYVNSRGYISKFGSWGRGYHVEIMEKMIGRKLKKNESVHHINLDKQDNSIENLLLLTENEHQKLHGKLNILLSQLIKNGTILLNFKTKQYELSKKEVKLNV
jgi:endogenous inhibitor of DNA gyrase (YacG/DUF329 family)